MNKDFTNGQNSRCCNAAIIGQTADGHGKCSECKENTVPDENNIIELSTARGSLREGDFVEYKGDNECQIYSIVDTKTVAIFYPSTDRTYITVKIADIHF